MSKKITIEWFPFYIEDYLQDTIKLTAEQHGIYLLIIVQLFRNRGSIPSQLKFISTLTGLNIRLLKKNWSTLSPYFNDTKGVLTHERVTQEVTKAIGIIEKRRKSGSVGGLAKAKASATANGIASATKESYQMLDVCSTHNSNSTVTDQKNKDLSSSLHHTDLKTQSNREEDIPPVDNSENPAPKTKKKKSSKKANGVDTTDTWWAYEVAYQRKYNIKPVRNQKTNSQMKQFVQRVGIDVAPSIAAFYVQNNNPFYSCKNHIVGMMLMDAEKLYTDYQQTQQEER